MAQKRSTRRARVQQKTAKPKAAPKTNEVPPAPKVELSTTLPSVRQLTRQAALTDWQHRGLFGGIALVYGLLTIVFVTGFGAAYDIGAIRDQFSSRLLGSLAAYTQLVINPTGSGNAATGVYQFLLLLGVSLALIWTLRQVSAGRSVTVKDAYYQSMYPLVPCLLVFAVICLQLLPMIVGSTLYQLVITNQIAVSSFEITLWASAALALSLVSLYFLAASIFAFYIATLPDMQPLKALRLSKQLVSGRRWAVLRKLLFLPLVLLLLSAALLLPLILILPGAAGWCAMVVGPLMVVFVHTYIYTLYRGLMNE